MNQNEIAKCKCGETHLGFDQIVPSIDRTRVFCPCGGCGPWSSNKTEAILFHKNDQQTWILCSERMPISGDQDKNNEVLWRVKGVTMLGHWTGKDVAELQELKKFGKWTHLPPDPEEPNE